MWVRPVPTEEFLGHAMRTADSCGYAALIVVLARTADAREQHEELTRDWMSLHDVTGPLIAVLCPDPEALDAERGVAIVSAGRGAVCGRGLRLQHHAPLPRGWARNPSAGVGASKPMGFPEPFHIDRGRSRWPAEDHHEAWTEAASRCASYFGIVEELVPSLLVLSLWEKRAVLVRLQPKVSVYAIIKTLVARLGDRPGRMVAMQREASDVARSLADLEIRQTDFQAELDRSHRRFQKWRAKVEALVSQLHDVCDLDPELAVGCEQGLRATFASGHAGRVSDDLRRLHAEVRSRSAEYPVRHSVVWGLVQRLESGIPLPKEPAASTDPYAKRIQQLRSALKEGADQLHRERRGVRLADATVTACCEHFSAMEVAQTTGRDGLAGWELILVGHTERPRLGTIGRRA
jgi:hypothetical protein